MIAFTHVLAPIDLGEATREVLDQAVTMARPFGAKVTVLHAFFVPPLTYANELQVSTDELVRELQTMLEVEVSKTLKQYHNIEGLLVCGEPWEQILRVARGRGADLIVMGTHGRYGLTRVVLGSVAEKVVRLSSVPVLTISTHHKAAPRAAAE